MGPDDATPIGPGQVFFAPPGTPIEELQPLDYVSSEGLSFLGDTAEERWGSTWNFEALSRPLAAPFERLVSIDEHSYHLDDLGYGMRKLGLTEFSFAVNTAFARPPDWLIYGCPHARIPKWTRKRLLRERRAQERLLRHARRAEQRRRQGIKEES